MNIIEFAHQVDQLNPELKATFERIFTLKTSTGRLVVPDSMEEWVTKQFGSVETVEEQKIVRLHNNVTDQGVLYNSVRALRPETKGERISHEEIVEEAKKGPFAKATELTPEDVFGRIKGKHSITASNVAKYDGWHGLVIFDEPDPLTWEREHISDYFDVASQWVQKVHEQDDQANYPYFQWNCLWKAGASLVWGHAQISVARQQAYTEIERWRSGAEKYEREFGVNYFDDYFTLHDNLGLAYERNGVRVMASLDSKKEREIQLHANSFDQALAGELYEILKIYRDEFGVQTFNVGGYLNPVSPQPSWEHMPVVLRVIDRGDLTNRNTDVGIMERFAQEVVVHDPFATVGAFKKFIN